MGIVPYKANNGYEPISRYAPIAPGNYKSGQALVLAAGKLAAASGEITVLPEGFLAYADVSVTSANTPDTDLIWGGNIAPYDAPTPGKMYRGVLNEDISTLAIGQMLAIATDGVSFSATEGSFEVTGFEGTKAGDIVYVRVPVTSYAGIVLSVNDVKPDANGNVDIATGG